MKWAAALLIVFTGPALAQAVPPSAGEAAVSVAAAQANPAPIGRYYLSGARELRPSEISDDGVHTYIRWHEEQELPAVFTLNAHGDEEMVDGYMRQGIYTIDRINPRLVFRIDKRTARADRSVRRP